MRIVQIPIIVPHVVVALFIVNILSQNGILARILANAGLITDQQQFPMLIYDRYGLGVILAYLWNSIHNLFCDCSDGEYQWQSWRSSDQSWSE